MISREQARRLVENEIKKAPPYDPNHPKLVVLDDQTLERDWGWVFFYDTEAAVASGDFHDSVVGNAPYIVNKFSGELIETGTAADIDHYIREYEATLQ